MTKGRTRLELLQGTLDLMVSSSWGTSESNRKAKFYAITPTGKRQLAREVEAWDQLAGLVARLRGAEQG